MGAERMIAKQTMGGQMMAQTMAQMAASAPGLDHWEVMRTPVMLSRVADCLYWMGRYLERAKHTARLLNVHFDLMLDQSRTTAKQYRQYVLAGLQLPSDFDKARTDKTLTEWMTLDRENVNSVRSCVGAARENARQVREQVSTEMWGQINELYLNVEQVNIEAMWSTTPQEFFQSVKEGVQFFQGITDSTMIHGQGWHFIQAGRYIERAIATAALMDVFFCPEEHLPKATVKSLDVPEHLLWLGLLRSCTAFEAYCKLYTADIQPRNILEFLLLDAEFPHAVHHAVRALQLALQGIVDATHSSRSERAYRRAGRLRADLEYSQVDEITQGNLHDYFTNIQKQCEQIHYAIYQTYISYPVEATTVNGFEERVERVE